MPIVIEIDPEGNAVEILLEPAVMAYHEPIGLEGAVSRLVRAQDDNRLVGVVLPLLDVRRPCGVREPGARAADEESFRMTARPLTPHEQQLLEAARQLQHGRRAGRVGHSGHSGHSGLWSISRDQERYDGLYPTAEAAIEEGSQYAEPFWIGQCLDPTQPEDLWDATVWIEDVFSHEDYGGEWAEGHFDPSREQILELEAEVRPVMAAWLDRHGLRPKFWNIDPTTVRRHDP